MKNIKKSFAILICVLVMILSVSCRWDVWGTEYVDYGQGTGRPASSFMFSGDAPKYVTASQARFSDRILVSWNPVTGADYYEVYRAVTPNLDANEAHLDWHRMNKSPVGSSVFYDEDVNADEKYIYRVRARNFAYPGLIGAYSEKGYGWTLTPPSNITASQGDDNTYINLSWDPVDNVNGYRIYWSSVGYGDWHVAVPKGMDANDYVLPANAREYPFEPEKQFKGASLYFYIESISKAKGVVSNPSDKKLGYTHVEGAPDAPKNLIASCGDYNDKIVLEWDTQKGTDDADLDWEIYRSSEGEAEKRIYSTLEGDTLPTENGEKMSYVDRSNIKPGIEYKYNIRAIGKVNIDGVIIQANGNPSITTGFLLSPPTVVENIVITEKDGQTGFQFTFHDALGATDNADMWSYRVYASENRDSGWVLLPGYEEISINDVDRKTVFSPYDENSKFEYFDVRTYDGAVESAGYADSRVVGEPIAVFRPRPAEDFNASDNMTVAGVDAVDGFYPVHLMMVNEKYTVGYNVKVWTEKPASAANTPADKTYTVSLDNNSEMARLEDGMVRINNVGTTPIGTRYYYSVQGVDILGREGDWSDVNDGYSAITGDTLIKYMQPYALKPWEYIGKPVLTSEYPYSDKNVNQKWSNSAIYAKIKQAGTGSLTSGMTESSYFHNGSIRYAASVQGIGAKITFTYTNFGEVEYLKNNGFFTMVVDASGTGSCSGNFKIDGMYPATIGLGNMSVSSQAFSGTYTVRQLNGTEVEEVSPNQRY